MLFIVRMGVLMPCVGPSENPFGLAIGVVSASSKAEAARILGLITWDGWKNVPGVQTRNWRKWGKSLLFSRFDTKRIDRNPNVYRHSNRRIRFITIRRVKELKGKIPNEVWKKL